MIERTIALNLMGLLGQATTGAVEAASGVAPAGGAPAGGKPPPGIFDILMGPFFPIMLVLLILWVVVLRSKRTQDKQRQSMLEALKKGDRIETIGGAMGTVVEVRDGEVLVKVDETSNTKIRFRRSAIHRVIADDK